MEKKTTKETYRKPKKLFNRFLLFLWMKGFINLGIMEKLAIIEDEK